MSQGALPVSTLLSYGTIASTTKGSFTLNAKDRELADVYPNAANGALPLKVVGDEGKYGVYSPNCPKN